MNDPTGDVVQPSAVEVNVKNTVKTLFKGSSRTATEKGMLRWNLYKKVQTHPSCTITLVKKLVKQLQKGIDKPAQGGGISRSASTWYNESLFSEEQMFKSPVRIIPALHTLYYVVLQSPALISPRLYQAVYACLMRLLVLPFPYSAVALSTLKSIKMEMFTPGSLFHRRVIAEQSLKNDHLKLHERVFLLADPEVLSEALEAAVRAHLELCSSLRNPLVLKRNVLLRLLQSGLGSYCHSPTLRQALESLGDQCLEGFFQETVAAVEEGIKKGPEGWRHYINDLKRIYDNILTSSEQIHLGHEDNTVCPVSLPYPEINFILWNNEEDLWNVLTDFNLSSGTSFDLDEKSQSESVRSQDNGIDLESEFDIPDSPMRSTSALRRRKAYKSTKPGNKLSLVKDKMESSSSYSPSSRVQRSHTARIVVMGDDRILGKLASAYRSIQEKESKHIYLTKKMNLQFYYIPVTDAEPFPQPDAPVQEDARLSVASFLGKIDSWYDENINILQTAIPKLAKMQVNHNGPSEQNLFFLDTLCYYLRCGTQRVNLPLYKVMMTRCSNEVSSLIEEVFVSRLEADVAEFKHLKDKTARPCNRRKRSVVFGGFMSVSYRQTFLSQREVFKGLCPMACGAVITSEPSAGCGEDYLGVRFNSVNPDENKKIFTKTISIKAMENRTLVVCLDKDLRRTYTDIQRIEVFPCMDPGCNIQSRFSVSMNKELPLSKYVDKVLSLPINTFSGVTS